MATRRCVVLLVLTAVVTVALLLTSCARFDGVVDFEAEPRSGKRPLTVQFTPLVSGEIRNWIWDFGDGILSTERSPEHTYTDRGSYTVSLTVFPRRGEPTTASKDSYITITSGLGATQGPELYCASQHTSKDVSFIQRVSMDAAGNVLQQTALVVTQPGWDIKEIVVAGLRVFWIESTSMDESRMRSALVADGSAVESVMPSLEYPLGIEVSALCYAGGCDYTVYWAEFLEGKIAGRDTHDSVERTLVEGRTNPRNLALDDNYRMLYWTEEGGIFRTSSVLPATGTNQVTRVVNVLRPHGLALDLVGGKLYWAELQKIRRANLDGTQIETVLTVPLSDPSPDTIAVDAPAGKVYWTEFVESGRIRRANLDGTDTETVLGELDWPSGLHLVPASRTPGPGA